MTSKKPDPALHAADVSVEGGVITARIIGPAIEEHRASALFDSVAHALDQAESVRALILDFNDVSFINSSGLGAVIQLRNKTHAAGARAFAYLPNPSLVDIFKRSALDRTVTIVTTKKELAAALKPGA